MLALAMAAPQAKAQGGFEGPGRYQITNVGSGKDLALDRNDKTTVMQFQPLNKDSEQWDAHPADEGFWVIRNVMTGAALECLGPENGAPVRGMPFTQSPAQQWRIELGPRGNAMITSRVGKTLGVGGGGRADGDRMQLFERNGGPRQEFVFRRIVVAANMRSPSERDRREEREISETHSGFYDDRDGMWKLQGDGACFYRGANFQGKALCVRSGEEMPKVPDDWLEVFRSVKFFGRVREVTAFHDPDFQGARISIAHDERDLEQYRSERGETFQRTVRSLRVF